MPSFRGGSADYTTPSAGNRFNVPGFVLCWPASPDSAGEGLHELAEFIPGTNPNNPNADGDGIPDGVEIQNGTDPQAGGNPPFADVRVPLPLDTVCPAHAWTR